MNRPLSLLWFEGMDPQCLPPQPLRAASHGRDLQLESTSPVESEQCRYQASVKYERHEEEPLLGEDTSLILERLRELGYL